MALLQSSASSFLSRFPAVSPAKSVRLSPPYGSRRGGSFTVKAEAPFTSASGIVLVEKSEVTKVSRLKAAYLEKIVPLLKEEFKYTNVHQVPKVEKIVVNCGIGDAAQNSKGLDAAINDLARITGQRPVKTKAKNAIATFKIRKSQTLGIAVTLRGKLMYAFLDRLVNLGLPRVRDFQGVNPNSFDGHGNYSVGLSEQGVFPELSFDAMDRPRGMDVCITTTAETDKEAYRLLALMGMPFRESSGPAQQVVRKKKLKARHFEAKTKGKPQKGRR